MDSTHYVRPIIEVIFFNINGRYDNPVVSFSIYGLCFLD